MNIELTEAKQKQLIEIILGTKLGTLDELSKLTKYNQMELKSIIASYPNIKEAVEVKKQSQTESLLELGLNTLTTKKIIKSKAEVDLMKTVLDGIGGSYGYGKQDTNININNSNDTILQLSDEELEMELQQLDELDKTSNDKSFESYLNLSHEELEEED